ncbi:uncharacterized protein LOC100241395 [Vitis vinifera]|uniref:PTB domain-containing engulfment adapter protein 1 n=1 Tax=Vitis vinifera TaxID=29760 RepID=D7TE74_VITVI|eukprot:XP_002267467.1 PREDICTED: uncharacterized protein LOC100241395 [Vitis vinifera]
MASLFSKPTLQAGRDEVYVATMPLRATKGPPQLLMSAAYSLNLWDLQHFMVIIKPSSPTLSQAFVYDFQPKDPENVYVALAALSGRAVQGAVLERKLTKLPRSKWWLIGCSREDGVEAAHRFNKAWHTDLKIGYHDCRDYTNGLVEYLTGEKQVLKRLRSSISR